MNTTLVSAVLAALSIGVPAAAQVTELGPAEPQERSFNVVSIDPLSLGAPVMQAPYSAEAVTEITHVLADGNRIERRMSATVARASDGRTRREQYPFALPGLLPDSDAPLVTITDPQSGTHLTLNYAQKTALRMRPGAGSFVAGRRVDGPWNGRTLASRAARVNPAAPPSAGVRVGPGAPALPPDAIFSEPVMVGVEGAVAMRLDGPGAVSMTGGDVKTERLEPRTIEGLDAEGTRTTLTIPAGAIGNVMPIEVVSERWFSPQLQVVLMTRRFDPRFGETVYRLTNVSRDEPSADLFKVPAGFRIEDVKP